MPLVAYSVGHCLEITDAVAKFFFILFLLFIFKLYNIVLVLPNIEMLNLLQYLHQSSHNLIHILLRRL